MTTCTRSAAALGNIDEASSALPQTVRDLNALVARAARRQRRAGRLRTQRARRDRRRPARTCSAAAQRLHSIADHLASASEQLDKIIADNREDVRSFTRDGLPELERFVREGRAAAEDIRALSNSLRENPAAAALSAAGARRGDSR